mgnify:CR=1 FL=1
MLLKKKIIKIGIVDLGVKQDATFDKDYFKGKYGAIPIVQSFLDKGSVE